ncbi:thiamine pyrophosphate-dependent acetolactate synthase large subunit-like protein [Antricoccus suffuscus]|uniref:Thiamine pyrophosphate-dependent acetolactate synthase large subunit-like protein n=1 Tax=Antricoccus suffuscus TaxID=1629062 RepID=A0A2T0ZJQ0_9ACTN|nr:thiamine pyrophosphate-dependent enzyme [Antricoccus suffuscus]PRZ36572.1 thiamine pyrophosphate-dependent acetolactate synthase large subunit-like protein [Antricoccus suffuscus]
MNVAQAVGRALVEAGIDHVFGVVGSGNLEYTNAMVDAGARFVAARHESAGTTMADAFARTTGRPAAVTLHQGCGLTNAMTGITEAAKSRTALVVVVAETDQPDSNFYVDQPALAEAVGAVPMRITHAAAAAATARSAVEFAVRERRTVVLNVPLHLQAMEAGTEIVDPAMTTTGAKLEGDLDRFVMAIKSARRPVFIAGRGARGAGAELAALADRCGALLATSAVAKGMFTGNDWSLGVSGGFSSPLVAELIQGADLIVGWGCSLNMWTMRQGTLIGPDAVVVQVEIDSDRVGKYRTVDHFVADDARQAAVRTTEALGDWTSEGYRTSRVRAHLADRGRWRDTAYDDLSTDEFIDPRILTTRLDDLLPAERIVSVDSGNFMGYPSAFLDVPDEQGFCFTQAFQSIGLGLATAIGAALARPDRLPIATLGDGGALMAASEFETVVRLSLPMVVVIYNDSAYGAEVHHFGPHGHDLSTVQFPETDFAQIAIGYGFDGITVRRSADLDAVGDWLAGDRARPLLIDAKVVRDQPSWWLEEAFKGH